MKNLIILAKYNQPVYVIPLLLYITKSNKNINCCIVGQMTEQEKFQSYYNILKKNGVYFISEDAYEKRDSDILLIDASMNNMKQVRKKFGNILLITYQHSNDNFQIYPNTRHIVIDRYQYNRILMENNLPINNSKLIKVNSINIEIFIAGYYHYFEVLHLINQPKKILREKLEKKMGVTFSPNLPLLLYYVGERLREQKIKRTLCELAKNYNVIVKSIGNYFIPKLAEGKNLFLCSGGSFPLLKFASDFSILPIGSGALLSNFAFGLKTIPVYSYQMGERFSVQDERNIYEKYFASYNLYHYCHVFPFMQDYFNLVPPVSLYDVQGIRSLIENKMFWKNFEKKVNVERKKMFGDLILEDSIKNTANYILQILAE